MKIAEINTCHYGSTGKIMLQIAECARKHGHEAKTFSRQWKGQTLPNEEHTFFGSHFEHGLHHAMAKITGKSECYSFFGTKSLVKALKKFQPDVLHLHNLHGFYLHLPTLVNYIKKYNVRVVWTLHDCWAFTGHCPYFDMAECKKWRTGCHNCSQYKTYPKSVFDNAKAGYRRKQKWFTGVKDMTVVTPSKWLADLTKQSFLGEYPVEVIHNGIDLSVFKPTPSDFRKKYNCEGKYILLCVAFVWSKRKGMDVLIELSKRLGDNYRLVLVGTNEKVESEMPENVVCIRKTQNQAELAEIYTAADVYVNPTREDNFPTVNMESLACGTPVITFQTGGSPEALDETCGVVVGKGDVDGMEKAVREICEKAPFTQEACVARAKAFDKEDKFEQYVRLYESR